MLQSYNYLKNVIAYYVPYSSIDGIFISSINMFVSWFVFGYHDFPDFYNKLSKLDYN